MMSDLELLNSSEDNLIWFQENSSEIREKYSESIIAIKNKKIVATSKDLKGLRNDLKQKNINEETVLIEVIPRPNEITIL